MAHVVVAYIVMALYSYGRRRDCRSRTRSCTTRLVMAYVPMTYIVMAYIPTDYIAPARIAMAYTDMDCMPVAYIDMAYMPMAYIVMAYTDGTAVRRHAIVQRLRPFFYFYCDWGALKHTTCARRVPERNARTRCVSADATAATASGGGRSRGGPVYFLTKGGDGAERSWGVSSFEPAWGHGVLDASLGAGP